MNMTNRYKNILLNGDSIEQKRAEILEYFTSSYDFFEKSFEIFVDDEVFYEQPEPLRQMLLFYFGHTAVFFINKLISGGYIKHRLNEQIESIFAIGVDEMDWDNIVENDEEYFPSFEEIKEYRKLVKDVVVAYIQNADFSLPIQQNSDMWVVLMGVEHERIHLETSSVLHRQLDVDKVKPHELFWICDTSDTAPDNVLLDVKGGTVHLGKDEKSLDYYAWDNEIGEHSEDIEDFKASKFLVSNGEYLEFVLESGYKNDKFWSKEGIKWKQKAKAKYPYFWSKSKKKWKLKTLTSIIDMPYNWPAEVNHHEASAFCKFKSKKSKKNIVLPSEGMYERLREYCSVENEPENGNLNFQIASCVPVDKYKFGSFYDVVGNAWQWSSTKIYAFKGFKPHRLYDDFSLPTFDEGHYILKGGSWASVGNETLKGSRYAFRPHIVQHSGFRYVEITKQKKQKETAYYEDDTIVSQYCEFNYGAKYLGVKNFPKQIAKICDKYAPKNKRAKILDIGCSVGRSSFELKKYFKSVVGIDYSARFIQKAIELQKNKKIKFSVKIEGDISTKKAVTLKSLKLDKIDMGKIEFFQGDACNLANKHNGFDVIVAVNLLDRLYDPKLFLNDMKKRLTKNGILIVASPFTWDSSYVQKQNWLGGFYDKKQEIYSMNSVKNILSDDYELVDEPFLQEFVIQEHVRKFQHTFSLFSVWKLK